MNLGKYLLCAGIVIILAKAASPEAPTKYYSETQPESNPVQRLFYDDTGYSSDIKTVALSYVQTDEARTLIDSLSPETLADLRPTVIKLVQKLEAEGNDFATSKIYAAVLIAWISKDCAHLSKEGRQDFAQALVNASFSQPKL